ncbi:capsular associated protein [Mycena latifolia]|nr:capsular associated protein [Mycena latifolia]
MSTTASRKELRGFEDKKFGTHGRVQPNNRKFLHREHIELAAINDEQAVIRDEYYLTDIPRFDRGMLTEKRPSRRARIAYGWFHQQSGYIFLAVVFFAFLRAGLHAATPAQERSSSWIPLMGGSAGNAHPIPHLMDAADARFRAKLSRQSLSLSAAVAEYKRRYGHAPPAGFDKWYAFAKGHGFVMIDEFDAVVDDLKPFWDLSGEELRRRVGLVGVLPSIDFVRIRDGAARTVNVANGEEDEEVSSRAIGFKTMLSKFVHELPDMDFPINAKAEGRVIVPWEHRAYPNLTQPADELLNLTTFSPDWAGSGSVWEAWRRTCSPQSPARRLFSSLGAGWVGAGRDLLLERWYANNGGAAATSTSVGGGFGFVQETNAGVDFCASPGAHYEQGHFFSDWRTIPALVPVFSPARARGFLDIRIPSHYYYGGTRRYTYAWDPINLEQRAVDAMEVAWEAKRDAVWWRGASTGGGSSPPGFGSGYQRHRFLRMASVGAVSDGPAQERTTAVTFAIPPQPQPRPVVSPTDPAAAAVASPAVHPGTYTTVPVPLPALNADVMDAAFVKEVVPVGPEHRMGDSVELGVGWGYKYLLDLDGMGYSGHFMAYLASDSVPVKATVYDEYFTGWIEPWVHYIPLSATYAEIYNIVAYFSGPAPSVLRAANLSATTASREYAPASGSLFSAAHKHLLPKNGGVRRRELEDDEVAEREGEGQVLLRSLAQEEGDRRLRRIARGGKQWKRTMGRTIDMEVYVYRLALEYARLWADDREAMSYKS